VVRQYDSDIGSESVGVNHGSTFYMFSIF